MDATTRRTGLLSSACALALAGLLAAPTGASADELPPPPVMPGFENVVIAPRPLSGPALPVPVAPAPRPGVTTAAASKKTVEKVTKKTSKKVTKKTSKKAVKKAVKKVRVCTKRTVSVRGKKVVRTTCTLRALASRDAVRR